jgi:hypothetical protein
MCRNGRHEFSMDESILASLFDKGTEAGTGMELN